MSYIVAIKGPFAIKRHPDRIIYPTRKEAVAAAGENLVYDADHEPGHSIAQGKPLPL